VHLEQDRQQVVAVVIPIECAQQDDLRLHEPGHSREPGSRVPARATIASQLRKLDSLWAMTTIVFRPAMCAIASFSADSVSGSSALVASSTNSTGGSW